MKIEEEILITDLETLKVISDPLRFQILERVGLASDAGRLTTVKQLSEELDIPATKLYYHINLLEKHELIQIAETRVISGIIEKHYQTRAKRFRADLDISKNANIDRDEGVALTLSSIRTMFDAAYKNIEKSFEYRLRESEPDQDETATMLSSQTMLQLQPEQAEDFINRFNQLVKEYAGINHPNGLIYGLTIVFNPNYHIAVTGREETLIPGKLQTPLKDFENNNVRLPPQL